MNKSNMSVKRALTMSDIIEMTNEIVNGYFSIIEGIQYYTPYFKDITYFKSFIKNAVSGIEFEEDEDIDASILSDGELRELFEDWSTSTFSKNDTLHQQINDILENVKDMVEFRKQLMIAQAGIPDLSALAYIESKMEMLLDKEIERNETETKALNDLDKYIKDLSKLNDYQLKCAEMLPPEESAEIMRKMADNNFDAGKVAEIVADKYFGSNEHADKLKELFDYKQEEIRKKDAEIAEKNKKIVELSTGKNVLNKKK